MEKEMAINENWTIIPRETRQKHPPTHATPPIQEAYINHHTTKDWPRLHKGLPVTDTLNRNRIPSMHLRLPPPDTKASPARMQTLQHGTQATEERYSTTHPHLANGDAHNKGTSGYDDLSPKYGDRDKIMDDGTQGYVAGKCRMEGV